MDFLRRLDPGRVAPPGAARLDVAPRWLEPAAAPLDAQPAPTVGAGTSPPIRPGQAQADLTPKDRKPAAILDRSPRPIDGVRVPSASPRTLAPDIHLLAQPDRSPTMAAAVTAAPSPRTSVESHGGGPPTDSSRPRQAPATQAAPLSPVVPHAIGPMAARAVPDRPLRVDAVEGLRSRPVSAPPIVHVTIARIDVRLPTADTSPLPRERRPRAASAVAPLSDYLRRGGRG